MSNLKSRALRELEDFTRSGSKDTAPSSIVYSKRGRTCKNKKRHSKPSKHGIVMLPSSGEHQRTGIPRSDRLKRRRKGTRPRGPAARPSPDLFWLAVGDNIRVRWSSEQSLSKRNSEVGTVIKIARASRKGKLLKDGDNLDCTLKFPFEEQELPPGWRRNEKMYELRKNGEGIEWQLEVPKDEAKACMDEHMIRMLDDFSESEIEGGSSPERSFIAELDQDFHPLASFVTFEAIFESDIDKFLLEKGGMGRLQKEANDHHAPPLNITSIQKPTNSQTWCTTPDWAVFADLDPDDLDPGRGLFRYRYGSRLAGAASPDWCRYPSCAKQLLPVDSHTDTDTNDSGSGSDSGSDGSNVRAVDISSGVGVSGATRSHSKRVRKGNGRKRLRLLTLIEKYGLS
jgi:hypothetical protein